MFKIDSLCAISAFACLSAKATNEGHDLAGAGFTVLAISQGLFLAQTNQPGHWNDGSGITAVFFVIPSFILISYYSKFPKWLHAAGIISTIPFPAIVIVYYSAGYNPRPVFKSTIYLIYQLITLCRAWCVWKERKKNK